MGFVGESEEAQEAGFCCGHMGLGEPGPTLADPCLTICGTLGFKQLQELP